MLNPSKADVKSLRYLQLAGLGLSALCVLGAIFFGFAGHERTAAILVTIIFFERLFVGLVLDEFLKSLTQVQDMLSGFGDFDLSELFSDSN